MLKAPELANEKERLEKLKSLNILDSDPEQSLDDITETIANICDSKIALISLVDKDRQWFKSSYGLDAKQTPRDISFCGHVIASESNEIFMVSNAHEDERFKDNPLVTESPFIKFYAGCKLQTSDGFNIGSLCVIDSDKKELSSSQKLSLKSLAKHVVSHLELRRTKEELRARNNFSNSVLDNMLEGLLVHNSEGQITRHNKMALELLGLTKDQLLGVDSIPDGWQKIKLNGSVFPPEEYPAIIALNTKKKVFNVVMGIVTKQNTPRWIKVNSTPVEFPEGLRAITTFVDITEATVKQENQLKELNEIISSTPSCLKIINSKGELIDMNQKGLDLVGAKSLEEVKHQCVYDLVVEPHRDKFIQFNKKVCGGEKASIIFEMQRLDGSVRWIESFGAPYEFSSGEIGHIAITNDITERIESSEERKFILDSTQMGTWSWDVENDSMSWDENNYGIFFPGFPSEQLEEKHKKFAIAAREKLTSLLMKTVNSDQFVTVSEFNTFLGEPRYIETKGTIYRDNDGKPKKVLGVNWDKTKEHLAFLELEQQKKISLHNAKLASIGQLAAGVGHELNNPLTIIKGYLHLTKEKIISDDFSKENLLNTYSKIETAIERISSITDGLRTFSRVDNDAFVEFNLISVLNESISMIDEIYQKKNIFIEFLNETNKEEIIVKGSQGKLQQVFMNLFSNAEDALANKKEKKIKVSINIENGQTCLNFENNGEQIEEHILEKIFDPFFTTKEVGKGTGIGLSMSHNFIKELNGDLLVENVSRGGVLFKIVLPQINNLKLQEEPSMSTDKMKTQSKKFEKSIKVLVVDDEEEIGSLVSCVLEGMGLSVDTASNGVEALEIISKPDAVYDLVLSDMQMPKMGGVELLENIRKLALKKQPKFIFSTGGINDDLCKKLNSPDCNFDGYLLKPFDLEKVEEIVSDLI